MEEFSSWTANKRADLKHLLTPQIKREAFTLGIQHRHLLLIRMVFSTYQLIDDKELFVEPIRELVFREQYKEVSPKIILWQLFMCLSFTFSYCVALVVLLGSVDMCKVTRILIEFSPFIMKF
jgi:hypothetical protein